MTRLGSAISVVSVAFILTTFARADTRLDAFAPVRGIDATSAHVRAVAELRVAQEEARLRHTREWRRERLWTWTHNSAAGGSSLLALPELADEVAAKLADSTTADDDRWRALSYLSRLDPKAAEPLLRAELEKGNRAEVLRFVGGLSAPIEGAVADLILELAVSAEPPELRDRAGRLAARFINRTYERVVAAKVTPKTFEAWMMPAIFSPLRGELTPIDHVLLERLAVVREQNPAALPIEGWIFLLGHLIKERPDLAARATEFGWIAVRGLEDPDRVYGASLRLGGELPVWLAEHIVKEFGPRLGVGTKGRLHELLFLVNPHQAEFVRSICLDALARATDRGRIYSAVGGLFEATADDQVAQRIIEVSEQANIDEIARAAWALFAIGGETAVTHARRLVGERELYRQPMFAWAALEWTIDDLLAPWTAAGVVDRFDHEIIGAVLAEDRQPLRSPLEIMRILAEHGIALSFDAEVIYFPDDYSKKISELAAISGGSFAPSEIWQRPAEVGEIESWDRLEAIGFGFIESDRWYAGRADYLGNWIDVKSLVDVVNAALEAKNETRRFVVLESEGQVANIVFGDPRAITRAASTIGLSLAADNDAVDHGRAYEQRVIERLTKGAARP